MYELYLNLKITMDKQAKTQTKLYFYKNNTVRKETKIKQISYNNLHNEKNNQKIMCLKINNQIIRQFTLMFIFTTYPKCCNMITTKRNAGSHRNYF